jgi:hypothetical protein
MIGNYNYWLLRSPCSEFIRFDADLISDSNKSNIRTPFTSKGGEGVEFRETETRIIAILVIL